MATIPITAPVALGSNGEFAGVRIQQWAALQNGDDGQPTSFSNFADRSVQVGGVFGVGGTVVLEGTNDGLNWATLHDSQGLSLSITGPKIAVILEPCFKVRPRVTAGDTDTAINVTAMMRRGV